MCQMSLLLYMPARKHKHLYRNKHLHARIQQAKFEQMVYMVSYFYRVCNVHVTAEEHKSKLVSIKYGLSYILKCIEMIKVSDPQRASNIDPCDLISWCTLVIPGP